MNGNLSVIVNALLTLLAIGMAVAAAYHALMTKRDSKSAFAWIAFSLIIPFAGPIIYLIFGINRVSSAAQSTYQASVPEDSSEALSRPEGTDLRPLSLVGESVTNLGLRSFTQGIDRAGVVQRRRAGLLVTGPVTPLLTGVG